MTTNLIRNIYGGVWALEARTAQALSEIAHLLVTGNSNLISIDKQSAETREASSKPRYMNVGSGPIGSGRTVAVLSYKDVIVKYAEECGPTGTQELAKQIETAANDPSISAIVLDIDSGGGAADAVAAPHYAILEAKKRKPVIGYAGDGMVASAAYGIMSACTEIYATYDTDEIGSIGTYMTLVDSASAISNKLGGAKVEFVYATKSTAKNGGYREWLETGKVEKLMVNDLDPFNESFINLVKSARGERINDEVFDGRLLMAQDALSFGLIDGIKTFAEVLERAAELSNEGSSNSNQSNQQMKVLVNNMDATIDAINAGIDVTPESLVSANEELKPRGLALMLVASVSNLVDPKDLNNQVSDLTNSLTAMQSELNGLKAKYDSLKADADKAATNMGLTVNEQGQFIDQNNDPVTLADTAGAVVDQRNAYGQQAGVLEIKGAEGAEIDQNDGYVDPTIAYAEDKFKNSGLS